MFCKSMKIVVIGSNVKRKAGPRVGSVGYVLHIGRGDRTYHLPEGVLCPSTVLFTRFGFEKKSRLEKIPVILAAPIADEYSNPKKAINKCIRTLQSITLKHVIVASPAEENLAIPNEAVAKIICRLASPAFVRAVDLLFNAPFGVDEEYGDINKLRAVLQNNVANFSIKFITARKFSVMQELVHEYIVGKKVDVKDILNFVNICEVLSERVGLSGMKKHMMLGKKSPLALTSKLFDIYNFNTLTQKEDKNWQKALRAPYQQLAKELQHKGSLTIHKH